MEYSWSVAMEYAVHAEAALCAKCSSCGMLCQCAIAAEIVSFDGCDAGGTAVLQCIWCSKLVVWCS